MRLNGKTAMITGATGGIGEATAKLFLAEGANVMLVGRSSEKLAATKSGLGASAKVATAVADSADEAAIPAAVAATVKAFGAIDILFANAGDEGRVANVEDIEFADFERILRTNALGVWLAMKHCVPHMKARRQGSIIATASIAGFIGSPGMAPYIASKHAVCGLVKTAALELGPFSVRVNAIAPGPIDNRMIASLEEQMAPGNAAAVRGAIEAGTALKRYGTNEEVANFALFLAGPESAYCTGGIHLIDGGYVAA